MEVLMLEVTRERASVLVRLRIWIRLVCLIALSMSAAIEAQQITGDIVGTVTDGSGAAVPEAQVTVTNTGTRIARVTKSSATGDYVVNLLQPGTYEVKVTATGFKSVRVSAVQLGAGDRTRVDASLTIGEVSQSVTVEADASSLQTDSSSLSSTIGQTAVQNLPLNGRNFVQLAQVQPGVNQGPPNGLDNGTRPADLRQSATFSANGQDDVLNNEMIDGGDNNERLTGTIAVRSSLDAIDQVRVDTNSYPAEVGRTGGAVVNIITKSGTNDFHGDVFEFIRNDITDANSYSFGAKTKKSKLRWNQFGGSLGGPIVRNKAFFFGDYEGYRLRQGLSPLISTVPTLYEEQNPGDFSDVGGPVIPAAGIDPVALNYFKMYPAPNQGTNQYFGIPSASQNSDDFDLRGDVHFRDNDSAFVRFIYNKVTSAQPGSLPVVTIGDLKINPNSGIVGTANQLDYNSAVNYTHIFNASLIMNLFASFTRADNSTYPHDKGLNPNRAFGQPNVNSTIGDASGLAPIFVNGGANLGDSYFVPVTHADNTFQYVGSIAYTRGNHNIKSGASLIRRQLLSLQSSFPEGQWVFLGYPALLQGQYYTVSRNIDLYPPHFRVWETGAYLTDNWRLRKNLTVNMGVRYDLYTPYAEIHNHASTFDPRTGALLIAGVNGVSNTAGIQTDYRGFEPRAGAALDLGRGFVVRGGYGLSFFPMNTTSTADLKNPPFVSTLSTCGVSPISPIRCPAGMTRFADGLPLPTAVTLATPGVSVPVAVDPHYQTSYIHQANLTMQKEVAGNVFTASYVGLFGRDLIQLIALNAAAPSPAPIQTRRPYYSMDPNLGDVTMSQSHGTSNYNALQTSVDRRFSKGLAFNVNYTYAQNLANSTPGSEQGQGGFGIVPSQVNKLDYGNSSIAIRHVLAGTVNYALPIGQSATGLEAGLIKGWQVNVLGLLSTSVPFTVVNPSNVSNTTAGTNDRLDVIGNPHISSPSRQAFFNPGAFASQAKGTLGNEGFMQYFGPHFRHLDVGLSKTIALRERVNLDFTAQSFNLFNTPNFANPNAALPAVTAADTPTVTLSNINNTKVNPGHFGQITSMISSYTPRVFQFSLKLRF
jgi:Carboxypeptidase regulatory-like domain